MRGLVFFCMPPYGVVHRGPPAWLRFSEASEWGCSLIYNSILASRGLGFRLTCGFRIEIGYRFGFTALLLCNILWEGVLTYSDGQQQHAQKTIRHSSNNEYCNKYFYCYYYYYYYCYFYSYCSYD